jgi:type II secretory pathway predicted ATPase ExeA
MHFLKHWSLQHLPFSPVTSPEFFFAGRGQREAIARLDYMVRTETRSALLLSERGCGATTLLRRVSGSSGLGNAAVDAVLTSGGVDTTAAALARLAVGLLVDPFGDQTLQRISEAITASGRHQVRTLWLIDRCDAPTAELASRLSASHRSLLVVMCTAPQAASALHEQLDGCPLRIELPPFDLHDTVAYVRFCMAAAGAVGEVFDDSALVRLHELSDGKVAVLAALAQLGLAAAAQFGAKMVTADCIESVQHELVRAA